MTKAVEHVAAMAPYALADMEVPCGVHAISLSQNESLRAPSPRALEAAKTSVEAAALYPDPDWTDLRHALATLHGLSAEGILCGCGSLDLIGCIARAFAGPHNSVLAPEYAYPFFRTASQMAGARFDTAPETEMTVDTDALLAAVRPETRVVFVANPGNPTGTRVSKDDLIRLRSGLPEDTLLVIDEAYGEFEEAATCFDMVEQGNTVVLRTFSKAYALAGFRVGWGVFPPAVTEDIRKVMNPNNVSVVSQAAALAALSDQTYLRETCALTIGIRDRLAAQLKDAGFSVCASHTNFLLIVFASEAAAKAADERLRSNGLIARRQSGAGLPHALRITVGSKDAMERVVTTLVAWKKETAS